MKVAVAQIAPAFLNRTATLERVVAAVREAVREAAREAASLVAFGEALIPAYPLWLSRADGARFDNADQKRLHALYVEQAVCIERDDLRDVCGAAADGQIAVVLGVAERAADRGGHSLFCSRVFIGSCGRVLSVHRKLVPTYEERLAWGYGDGAGLVTHPVGPFTVGALNCWENWMPLARAALYALGEDLHVMLWPGSSGLTRDITRFVAREGRSFVLSASNLLRSADIPADVPLRDALVDRDALLYDGGACIAGPDGEWIVPPVSGREGLLFAELDPRRVLEERQNFDPVGHYCRPEVMRLRVDRRRHASVNAVE